MNHRCLIAATAALAAAGLSASATPDAAPVRVELACPEITIREEVLGRIPFDWSLMRTHWADGDGERDAQRGEVHEFTRGHPRGGQILMPIKTSEGKGRATYTWYGDNLWYTCRYTNSTLTLSRPKPANTSACHLEVIEPARPFDRETRAAWCDQVTPS